MAGGAHIAMAHPFAACGAELAFQKTAFSSTHCLILDLIKTKANKCEGHFFSFKNHSYLEITYSLFEILQALF